MVLGHVAASIAINLDAKLKSARNECDRPGRDFEAAKLGGNGERSHLRNDQQLAVGIDEYAVRH